MTDATRIAAALREELHSHLPPLQAAMVQFADGGALARSGDHGQTLPLRVEEPGPRHP